MITSTEFIDRWWAWLGAVVIVAWTLGYAMATSAWDVVLVGVVLLGVVIVLAVEAHRRTVDAATDDAKDAWRRALARRGDRL